MNTQNFDEDYNSKINKLNWNIQPKRDLWPAIHSNIDRQSQQKNNRSFRWQPYAIAASLVLMLAAAIFNYRTYQETQTLALHQSLLSQQQLQQLALLSVKHQNTRLQLNNLLNSEQAIPDEGLAFTVKAAMDAVDLATQEINLALNNNPENAFLYALLEETYAQEHKLFLQLQHFQPRPTQHTF